MLSTNTRFESARRIAEFSFACSRPIGFSVVRSRITYLIPTSTSSGSLKKESLWRPLHKARILCSSPGLSPLAFGEMVYVSDLAVIRSDVTEVLLRKEVAELIQAALENCPDLAIARVLLSSLQPAPIH